MFSLSLEFVLNTFGWFASSSLLADDDMTTTSPFTTSCTSAIPSVAPLQDSPIINLYPDLINFSAAFFAVSLSQFPSNIFTFLFETPNFQVQVLLLWKFLNHKTLFDITNLGKVSDFFVKKFCLCK